MSLGGGGRGQLQELADQLEAVEAEITELEAEVSSLRTEQSDIDDAIEAIETLDSGSTVQVPLGGGAYLRAEIMDIDEVIVSLGGGYAAEQDQDNAIDALERKQNSLDDRIDDLQSEITELEGESEQLEQQLQQMQQQMQQQQMQQLQQQADDE